MKYDKPLKSQLACEQVPSEVEKKFGERVGASSLCEQSKWDRLARRKRSDSLADFFFPASLGACSQATEILIRLLIQVRQLVEQALNTSSGNGGDVSTLILLLKTNNLILVHKL